MLKVPCFQKEVDIAMEIAVHEMHKDSGEFWPRIFTFDEDGKFTWMHLDPNFMSDWRRKNIVGAMIVKACFEHKVAIFMSDAFTAQLPPGKTREDMPRDMADWPKSLTRENLIVTVNARGMKGFFINDVYTRDDEGRRIFAPEAKLITEVMANRFVYDLSTASKESATLDALLRNREGEVQFNA